MPKLSGVELAQAFIDLMVENPTEEDFAKLDSLAWEYLSLGRNALDYLNRSKGAVEWVGKYGDAFLAYSREEQRRRNATGQSSTCET